MQAIFIPTPTGSAKCILPGEMECVIDGVKWGSAEETLTPAYWAMRYRLHDAYGDYRHFQLGRSLAEELAACLLGDTACRQKLVWRRSTASGMRGCWKAAHPRNSSRGGCRNHCR